MRPPLPLERYSTGIFQTVMNNFDSAGDQTPYYFAFSQLINFIGPSRLRRLRERYGGYLQEAWAGLNTEDLLWLGIPATKHPLFWEKKVLVNPEAYFSLPKGVSFVTEESSDFPENLRNFNHSPAWLYLRGEIITKDSFFLAVVGSRRASSYGKQVVERLIPELVYSGITIVSGLAYGIDSLAHQASLNSGGRTLAVLASGVDNITPRGNTSLAERILEKKAGAIVSEFPLGTSPEPYYFPIRNRIISGLSSGVLVVEAAARSGTLITVGHALDQGRDVFAVPGSIFSPQSSGTHSLLQDGAKLVTSVEDILSELNIDHVLPSKKPSATNVTGSIENTVLSKMTSQCISIEDLVSLTGLRVEQVSASLTVLEMGGMVRNIDRSQFFRT